MLLAIDAGNTNTVFAIFDGETLRGQWRMATDARRTADEYGVWLLQLLQRAGVKPEAIKNAIISTVVPQALFSLRMLCRHYFQAEAMVVGDADIITGMEIRIDRPSEVGADRLVNAVAAYEKYGAPLVVVDFGTATTFDVISQDGAYIGGVIAPGIHLSLEALHRAAAKLPNIAVEKPLTVVGTSTISAMQSGIYYGYVGLIEGVLTRIDQERGVPHHVVATGGLASLFAQATPRIHHLDSDLTMWGLKRIFSRNVAG